MDINDPNISKAQREWLMKKEAKAARQAELAAMARRKEEEKIEKLAEKKAEQAILDATKIERTTYKGTTVSALIIMRVVDFYLRFPNATHQECATALQHSQQTIKLALSTPMAKSRLESAYDMRPLAAERLKNQAMNAFELLELVNQRAYKDLQNEDKAPDAPLLSAAVRSAIATLQGVGVLKEHQIMSSPPPKSDDITKLVDKTSTLQESFQKRLNEVMEKKSAEEFAAGEVITESSAEN